MAHVQGGPLLFGDRIQGLVSLSCDEFLHRPSPESSKLLAGTNSNLTILLTGQLADKPTWGQSSRGLDNSQTSQLADSEFLKIMEMLYFICALNLTLTLTLTLSNIGSI